MTNSWTALVWKECREHLWKFVSIAAALCGASTLPFLLVDEGDRLGGAVALMLWCIVPMAMFLGLSAASSERSRSTLPFLQAMPVPLWRVAVLKLVVGSLTLIAAVLTAIAWLAIWIWVFRIAYANYAELVAAIESEPPPTSTGYLWLDATLFCSLIACSLFVWSASAGVNRKDEVSAAVAALAAILGAWLLFAPASFVAKDHEAFRDAISFSLVPGGFPVVLLGKSMAEYVWIGASLAFAVHAALVGRYVYKFGRVAEARRSSLQPAPAVFGGWLGPPRRSPLSAIIWKQLRETGVIAIAGSIAILGIGTFLYLIDHSDSEFADHYGAVALMMGYGIAVVAGIGVALHDCEARLNTFWRTRPIDPNLWFAVKFLTGLVLVMLTVYVPILAVTSRKLPGSIYELWFVPITHIALYAAAVAATCLVRQAIYAAVLSLGFWVATLAMPLIAYQKAVNSGFLDYQPRWETVLGFIGAVTCLVISILAAWLSMRYDWGVKGRV